jgi:hypothetical protein
MRESAQPISDDNHARWTLDRDGLPVGFALAFTDTTQLEAYAGGENVVMGHPAEYVGFGFRPLSPAMPPAPEGVPAFAAVMQYDEGLSIAWPDGEGGSLEQAVPDSGQVGSRCPIPALDRCENSVCAERYDFVAVDGFAVTQTSDGRLWLVWLESHVDQQGSFTLACNADPFSEEETCTCYPAAPTRRDNHTTLHLARFDFSTRELVETLSLALPQMRFDSGYDQFQDARVLDARAFDDQLAIGLRTEGEPRAGAIVERVQRLLHIDTSQLE